jgi:hypothetical protein
MEFLGQISLEFTGPRTVGKKAWDEETHRNSSTTPCPICTFFERDDAGYHPLPNSLLGEVLHASIAGTDVRRNGSTAAPTRC